MTFLKIDRSNLNFVKKFVDQLGPAAISFRYFNSRPVEITLNHRFSCLLMEGDQPVGYGHLENENDITWLGIAILPSYQHKGYGKKMMEELIKNAIQLDIPEIKLTVDKDNIGALKLYENFHFTIENETSSYYIFKRLF